MGTAVGESGYGIGIGISSRMLEFRNMVRPLGR